MSDIGSNLEEPVAAAAPAPRVQKAKQQAPVGLPETQRILLEENENIPPGGLFLGHNGRGYMLQPGEEADVPLFLVEILDNATMTAPVIDPQTKRVIGWRDKLRYPYRVIK